MTFDPTHVCRANIFDPTEETWTARPSGEIWVRTKEYGSLQRGFDRGEAPYLRARLASAAPDMARVLLRLDTLAKSERCPCCPYKQDSPEHTEGCDLDAALRKAGVR